MVNEANYIYCNVLIIVQNVQKTYFESFLYFRYFTYCPLHELSKLASNETKFFIQNLYNVQYFVKCKRSAIYTDD